MPQCAEFSVVPQEMKRNIVYIDNKNLKTHPGDVGPDSTGPRFSKSHTSHTRASSVPAFICSDVSLVIYVTTGPSFLKILMYNAYAFLFNIYV